MQTFYKLLAQMAWLMIKTVGKIVVALTKLVAPALARRLQERLTTTGRRITGKTGEPAVAEH